MIKISDSAREKIISVLAEENDPSLKLRMFVQGGGCSGLQYGFTFDSEQNDDDFDICLDDTVTILIDSISAQYLQGAEVDYVQDLMGESFKINNPQAKSTCGCGNSFSAGPDWDI